MAGLRSWWAASDRISPGRQQLTNIRRTCHAVAQQPAAASTTTTAAMTSNGLGALEHGGLALRKPFSALETRGRAPGAAANGKASLKAATRSSAVCAGEP